MRFLMMLFVALFTFSGCTGPTGGDTDKDNGGEATVRVDMTWLGDTVIASLNANDVRIGRTGEDIQIESGSYVLMTGDFDPDAPEGVTGVHPFGDYLLGCPQTSVQISPGDTGEHHCAANAVFWGEFYCENEICTETGCDVSVDYSTYLQVNDGHQLVVDALHTAIPRAENLVVVGNHFELEDDLHWIDDSWIGPTELTLAMGDTGGRTHQIVCTLRD